MSYRCGQCEQTPAHPRQGLSAFQETQFDVSVWLGLSDRCLSLCQPSATSLSVLQAHTAKRTCSQPLAAAPQTLR